MAGQSSSLPMLLNYAFALVQSTKLIPPRTAIEAATMRTVNGSLNSVTPASDARMGTLNCTVDACIAFSPLSAAYHMA